MSRQYKHVWLVERIVIEKCLDQGVCQAEIARRLGRSPSTISREIARRSWRPSNTSAAYTPYRPASLRTDEWTKLHYRATIAQAHAQKVGARSHQARVMRSDTLVTYVLVAHVRDRLRRGWTPQEIAGRLSREFPDDTAMRVSHETLYAWIYHPAQKTLGLWQYLARGLRKRRKRGPARKRRRAPQIRFRVGIEQRPAEVEDRAEFGHWEADSLLGARGTGGLHTEVERTSRYLVATKIKTVTASATLEAQQAMVAAFPAHAVRSITADNGSEFAWHYKLADSTECQPTSPCRTQPGNAAPTNTSTHASANTSPNEHASTPSPTTNWPTSSTRSTTDPAKSCTGRPQPKSSTTYARPNHTNIALQI